jgi:hypothetical protein
MKARPILIILAALAALLTSGCQTAVKSGASTSGRPAIKEALNKLAAVAKQMESAQRAVLAEGSKVQTAKGAVRLVNNYSAAIYNMCNTLDNFLRFTPGLSQVDENSPEVKAFFKAMKGVKIKPLLVETEAIEALMARYGNELEMIAARSNYYAAEQFLQQWAERIQEK